MRVKLAVEELESRLVPAITSMYSAGVLSVVGDNGDNVITVSADSQGRFFVNESSIPGATKDNVALIIIEGKDGNDSLTVDRSVNVLDANGSLLRSPDSQLYGGKGDDSLQPQNGGIVMGLAGVLNGVVVGPVVGNCLAFGGSGDDTFISGPGNDFFSGDSGDDTYVWPPGTLTDVFLGGGNFDTAIIIGNAGSGDAFALNPGFDGGVLFQRTNLINFTVAMNGVEAVNLQPGTGADEVYVGDLQGSLKYVNVFVDGDADADLVKIAKQTKSKPFITVMADSLDSVSI